MKGTFGLDIGSTTIKALSLKKSGNKVEIESLGIGPTPAKGIMSESTEDLKGFAAHLKQILTSANIKEKEVNVSLPEAQVFTKIIDMPALSEKELSAALKYEMEQYIPLPLDQVKTDWQILANPSTQQQKTLSVLLVAAPIQLVQKYEQVLDMVGLLPSAIETEMISVHRALFPLTSSGAPSMVVHMGASTTNIAVVKNGETVMVFTVDKGGIAITRAISLDLGIDINQADSYKKAYGLNKEAFEGKIGKSLFPILESITGDIKKTMLLYKEKHQEEQINQIILSGGSAQLPGIDMYFTNQLNVQVVPGNCFQIYDIKNIPAEIAQEALSFNVVAGLALKDLL